MENMNINIVPDVDLMVKAQIKLHEKGLDLSTELNKYLQSIIEDDTKEKNEVFTKKNTNEEKGNLRSALMGKYKGKIWMADDFDEPLEDMREYME
ncbi:MAG: DUF2281 domain-containing protein [Candidatus Cloacimonetes bacterium]|nr:DUF2281 domain-containing protein [Candidatus Cloacimonadota bacterium]